MKKLIPIFVLLLAFAVDTYAMSCGFATPSNGGTLSAGSLVNITFAEEGITETSFTIYVNASSPSTANSSVASRLFSISNTTGGAMAAPLSFNWSLVNLGELTIEDASDYTLSAAIENSTARINCNSTRTNIIIDRTTPQKPTSLTTAETGDGGTVSATVNGANTTGCSVSFGLGGIRKVMTHSGNTCTFTVGVNNPPDGIYDYRVYATDGKDETASDVTSIEIDALANPARRSPSSLNVAQTVTTKSGGGGNAFIMFAIGFILLDYFLGFGIVFNKK